MRSRLLRCCAAVLTAIILFAAGFTSINVYAFNNEVKSGTVAVVFYLKGAEVYATDGNRTQLLQSLGDVQYSSGSGFFIGGASKEPQYIVTNCHVIDSYVEASSGEIRRNV